MPSAEDISDAVNRYIGLVAKGSADDIAACYAKDAVVEDPVGIPTYNGRDAIRGFYSNIENIDRDCELVTLRVAGNEAAFQFRLIVGAGKGRMLIEPIDVMVFNDDLEVTGMKAYWSPANVTQI